MTRRSLTAIIIAASATLALAGCAGGAGDASGGGDYVTDGKLTIATGEPAYFPWVLDDDPESGEGFEAAVAYAVADELGFAADDVVWVRSTFEQAIAPGPKDFDINLQQFSITDEREQNVDFSSPYYETTQVVITTESSPAASATSIADLKDLLVGAQTGTTSFAAVEEVIAPTAGAQVFNTNDDAKLALQSGTVDAIVVDLPTAFYLTGVELDGGKIVGQLPATAGGGDAFGLVLAKGSPLTAEVTAAVDALRERGTLDELAAEWLGGEGGAPVLE
ncbi:amino acid ABC transporter substrate-binding protein [Agromyces fucosus]|uniref:Amino acid ABC transporter substrate-binding protein n=1 Tax=Agromyces fucosus TaxID=41985 RepID=A0A4Q2JKI9_9MICO|nr:MULTISPECIES: ABC transporter substrate-binding protein [Agromyces]KQZ07813.1 ABC transporter substrate-binding protein [Agromyces sp. Root1464]RXZ46560.1 amino acid ABC transporter substrate-binding protein [Agromyces fucosus]